MSFLGVVEMMGKDKLVERIEETELERAQIGKDVWEKHIYLDNDKILIVGYEEEESFNEQNPGEEKVKNYYWYWELRDSGSWDVLFDNHEKEFNFCESIVGEYADQDRVEDIVGDIEEEDVCTWSEQDWIEDISEDIADETIEWLENIKK
jgi:hypothetical protein